VKGAPNTRALLAILLLAGCGPPVDPKAVAAVQVSGAGEAPRGCRLLGPVVGQDGNRWVPGGPRLETAMLDLRQKAVTGGGNYLAVDAIVPPRDGDYNPIFVVRARLYGCDTSALAASASGPPVPAASPSASAKSAPPPATATAVAAAPSVTPPRVCEPDCSPGYTCLRGTCVSACNPACTAGERCGADRICHPVAPVSAPAPVSP